MCVCVLWCISHMCVCVFGVLGLLLHMLSLGIFPCVLWVCAWVCVPPESFSLSLSLSLSFSFSLSVCVCVVFLLISGVCSIRLLLELFSVWPGVHMCGW